MRPEDQQEQLSLAALHATCAKAGFGFKVSGRIQDNWGWDAEADVYEKLDDASILTDFKLKFQVKATKTALPLRGGRYSFPLQVPHYNQLRRAGSSDAPTYLVVFQMPHEEGEWCETSQEQLVLKHCLRWLSLRNAPDTQNESNISVYIPEVNLLTPDALRRLARTRSCDEWIDYASDA